MYNYVHGTGDWTEKLDKAWGNLGGDESDDEDGSADSDGSDGSDESDEEMVLNEGDA